MSAPSRPIQGGLVGWLGHLVSSGLNLPGAYLRELSQ